MRRTILILLAVLGSFLALGLALIYAVRSRENANRVGCANNLRILARLGMTPGKKDVEKLGVVWPGTVENPSLKPEESLSWAVLALPTLPEPGLEKFAESIDMKAAWNEQKNAEAGRRRLRTLTCPGYVPPLVEGYAPTAYAGIAGIGEDAASLSRDPLSTNAGAFQYGKPTPFSLILAHDGVAQTLFFGQTNQNLGPWIRGGQSTVRGILDSSPVLAPQGGQFGGTLTQGAYFAMVDGSVKLFSYKTDPEILRSLATISGGKKPLFDD